jgi:MFS family permease
MNDLQRKTTTYRYEKWRAISSGVTEAAGTVFLLLIAVRAFDADPLSKAAIAGGASVGLLLTPLLVSQVERWGLPVAVAASRFHALGAVCFLFMALVPTLPVFVLGSAIALTSSSACIPLLTQIYQENYPAAERGRLFARTMLIRIATAAAFSDLASRWLAGHMEQFRWLIVCFALASGFASFCLSRCPSKPLTASGGTHPFHALRYVRSDRVFRQTLVAWMFIGFAMLMISPMRVEFLANPAHGVRLQGDVLSAVMVAMLTGVIPNLARLVLNPVWGWLFDKMNFFVLRLLLNLGFALGIISFFATGSLPGLILGAVLFGIANAGADVAWGLWVTKFAPPERVADYMSVHTFFTGIRGVLAPVAAFYLVAHMPPAGIGWISVALLGIGSAFLIPEIKLRAGKSDPVLMEKAPE